jgi:hypothetical protein
MELLRDRELPAKSHPLLATLRTQRILLSQDLSRCIKQWTCHDPKHAKDYLCAYVCSIFDVLWAYYDLKIDAFDYEVEIANEAVQEVISAWENYNVLPATSWTSTLKSAIALHTGRPIWEQAPGSTSLAGKENSDYTKVLLMKARAAWQEQRKLSPPSPTAKPSFAAELDRHLELARMKPESIAEKVGIQPRNVYRHLAGDTQPSLENVGKYEAELSKILKKPVTLPTPVKRHKSPKRQ